MSVYTTADSVLAQAQWLGWPYVAASIADESGWRAFVAAATPDRLAGARDWLRDHARAMDVFEEWDRRDWYRRAV